MSALTTKNVRITGLAACVPSRVEENISLAIFENHVQF